MNTLKAGLGPSEAMAGFNPRRARREAADNLAVEDEGDCPRCGGDAQPSTMSAATNGQIPTMSRETPVRRVTITTTTQI
jgi:hypothetical protein